MRTDLAYKINMSALLAGMQAPTLALPVGRVSEVIGLTVKSVGPHVSIGDIAWIESNNGDGPKRIPRSGGIS